MCDRSLRLLLKQNYNALKHYKHMVYYEWSLEYTDKDGDIIHNDFTDKVADFGASALLARLCLVRNVGNEIDGLQDRQWAYVKEGKLPVFFEDSAANETTTKVPKRFHVELKLSGIY